MPTLQGDRSVAQKQIKTTVATFVKHWNAIMSGDSFTASKLTRLLELQDNGTVAHRVIPHVESNVLPRMPIINICRRAPCICHNIIVVVTKCRTEFLCIHSAQATVPIPWYFFTGVKKYHQTLSPHSFQPGTCIAVLGHLQEAHTSQDCFKDMEVPGKKPVATDAAVSAAGRTANSVAQHQQEALMVLERTVAVRIFSRDHIKALLGIIGRISGLHLTRFHQ